jgi:hypothetical protein
MSYSTPFDSDEVHDLSMARGAFQVMVGNAYAKFQTFPITPYMYPFVVRYEMDDWGSWFGLCRTRLMTIMERYQKEDF